MFIMNFILLLVIAFLFHFIDPAISPIIFVFGLIVLWLYDLRKELTAEEKNERKKTVDAEVTSFWWGGDSSGPCGGPYGGACGG